MISSYRTEKPKWNTHTSRETWARRRDCVLHRNNKTKISVSYQQVNNKPEQLAGDAKPNYYW